MVIEHARIRRSTLHIALLAALAAVLVLFWRVIASLLTQLAAGYLLMALALPICRLLEKRLKPSLAAALSFAALAVLACGAVLLALPPLVKQIKQLGAMLPNLLGSVQGWLDQLQAWLNERGMSLTIFRDELFTAAGERVGRLASLVASAVGRVVQSAGKLFLAPLIAFYLLRDRRQICIRLLLLAPVRWRTRVVRAAREMKRETLGFLRGQLLLSAAVGAMTSVGLLLAGTPGWLALGLLMGVMEMIPYIGPVIAGIPAVLLSLQGGLMQGIWALIVLLIVQQVEGGVLSPQLLSGATRLHPLMVLAAISAGGILSGAWGMLLAIPLVVSVRGAARGLRA